MSNSISILAETPIVLGGLSSPSDVDAKLYILQLISSEVVGWGGEGEGARIEWRRCAHDLVSPNLPTTRPTRPARPLPMLVAGPTYLSHSLVSTKPSLLQWNLPTKRNQALWWLRNTFWVCFLPSLAPVNTLPVKVFGKRGLRT